MTPVQMFEQFLADPDAPDMYIEGEAGTGKTTQLIKQVEFMDKRSMDYTVAAYTHKACGVLATKLPPGTPIRTFHSWLKKVPTINVDATAVQHIDSNSKIGASDALNVLCVDEFSMINEEDRKDLLSEQFDPETGDLQFKVLWLGDKNQTLPIRGSVGVVPEGKYWIKLDKQHRQDTDNPLYGTLRTLVSYIEGADVKPLVEHECLIRDIDLVTAYKEDLADKVLLAYTNQQVEELNACVQGRYEPRPGDELFSPTTKHRYKLLGLTEPYLAFQVDRPFGEALTDGDKYGTLKFLRQLAGTLPIQFMHVYDYELDEEQTVAAVFGHYQFKLALEELKLTAAMSNERIEGKYKDKAAAWAMRNGGHPAAMLRAKAWRRFLTVNQNCMCLDFAHAMTVHKSQGSTYEHVYVDTEDMLKARRNMDAYLRLMYVAFSRASSKVFTN